jgi:HPt (histidine-containing phosphotransfer) domain-containing protein
MVAPSETPPSTRANDSTAIMTRMAGRECSPSASVPQTTLFDHQRLETFITLGIDYLDLLGNVSHDVSAHLERIRAAIKEGKPTELNASAHSLRGLLAYFGCVAMTARLAQLENQETLAPDQATAIDAELHALWENSLAAIRHWQQSRGPLRELPCE